MFSRKIISWSLYDFANTIFSMNIVSRYFPVMAVTMLGATDIQIGVSRSAAMILVALTMPVLGAIADRTNRLKLPLLIFTICCCGLTALISTTGILVLELTIFALAIFCFQSALVFYNALLPSVAPDNRIGQVSGLGIALGYVGSVSGLFAVAMLSSKVLSPYLWTAVLFLIFSIPLFLWVDEKKPNHIERDKNYKTGLMHSLRRAKKIPGLIRFFVGRFFVVEAMETVILFMSLFLVKSAGFKDSSSNSAGLDEVTLYLIIVTSFTIVGSYAIGVMVQNYGSRNMLTVSVILWLVALIGIIFLDDRLLYYIWGALAGIGLGGVWTADRPLMINLIKDKSKMGEFFGLYALTGRLAAVVGPLIWGVIILLTESFGVVKYKLAVGSLMIMMIIGLAILRKVPDAR